MAPRTRATAAAPVAGLSAAPRRRVKVTPLDNKAITPKEPEKPVRATRAARSFTGEVQEPVEPVVDPPKTRGRPKKNVVVEDKKPKRTRRSIVAADERPKRATRATKLAVAASTEESNITSAGSTAEPRKRVTFEVAQEDKENLPVTRATRKTISSKETKKSETGIKAKPVRKTTTTTASTTRTAGKKRARDTAEDKDEQTRPAKRMPSKSTVLTPKKITQVARAHSPEEVSEDELNGGKTPVRDLSLSPRRPQNESIALAMAQRISPAKKLDFTHLTAQSAPNLSQSPARRPPTSPAKQPGTSRRDGSVEAYNTLASPARRLPQSSHMTATAAAAVSESASPKRGFNNASRLLFPNHVSSSSDISQLKSSQNLLQSPKRSGALNISKIFPQSEIKPAVHDGRLFKSSTLSSPAKRMGLFSPIKRPVVTIHEDDVPSTAHQETPAVSDTTMEELTTAQDDDGRTRQDDIDELLEQADERHPTEEVNITSYQRASLPPIRPVRLSLYALSPGRLEVDFNDSILDVRSPLKVARSPMKAARLIVDDDETILLREDEKFITTTDPARSEYSQSAHTTPQRRSEIEELETLDETPQVDEIAQFIHLNTPSIIMQSISHEVSPVAEDEDVVMSDFPQGSNEQVFGDLANLSAVNVSQEEFTTPAPTKTSSPKSSPNMLDEHELTRMIQVDDCEIEARSSRPASAARGHSQADTPMYLHEHELTQLGDSSTIELEATPVPSRAYGLDVAYSAHTSKDVQSPATLCEHELTMMAGDVDAPSPVALDEHELTLLGARTPVSESLDQVDALDAGAASVPEETRGLEESTEPAAPCQATMTPDQPVIRRFKLHTTISKLPLKAAMQSPSASPLAMSIHKKRKRAVSLGSTNNVSSIRTPLARNSATPKNDARTPLVSISKTAEATILSGVVAYLDIRTSDNADASPIYNDIITQYGGRVILRWTDGVTHVVYKSSSTRTLDRVAEAITAGQNVKVVGLRWVLDCQKQNAWLDETPYLIDISNFEQLTARSVGRGRAASTRRRTMEPDMLRVVADGSIRRSSSLPRIEHRRRRKTLGVPTDPDLDVTPLHQQECTENAGADEKEEGKTAEEEEEALIPKPTIPAPSTNTKIKRKSRQSLAEAWSHIPSAQGLDLGADTPARKTLELLQRSYNIDLLTNENDEDEEGDRDDSTLETGLTPAPYRTRRHGYGSNREQQRQIGSEGENENEREREVSGSAPAKIRGSGVMSVRERMAEMERREIRRGGKERRRTAWGFDR